MQNQLATFNTQTLTMSSREIATLIGSQHNNLKISAGRLAEKGIIALQETPYTDPQNKQTYTEYLFSKRDSLILVAQNCPEFTAVIVDRWQELEAAANKPLTGAAYLLQQAQMMYEQEQRTTALEATVSQQSAKLEMVASKVQAQQEFYTVIGYANTLEPRIKVDLPQSAMLGKAACALSRDRGVMIGETSDPRFGRVKTYHEDILQEVFNARFF